MTIDRVNDAQAFREFLDRVLAEHVGPVSLDEALVRWDEENGIGNPDDVMDAIREGLADVEAGRTRPAEDVLRDLSTKLDLLHPSP